MKGLVRGWNAIKAASILAVAMLLVAGMVSWTSAAPRQDQGGGSGVPAPTTTAAPDEVIQQDEQSVTGSPAQQRNDGMARSGEASPTALGTGSYTYRHDWGYKNGWWVLTLNDSRITANSRVYVSLSEVGTFGSRFVGAARYSVYNIAPRNGAVTIRIFVDWGSPLHTAVDYLVVQPY